MLPRGPIWNPEAADRPDYSDNYRQALKEWREKALSEAYYVARMNPENGRIENYIRALEGHYWDKSRPGYRSSYYDNRLMDARVQALSMLSDIRPTIEVSTKVKEYEQQSNIANMVIRSEWNRNMMDLKLVDVIDHALLGVGYWKITSGFPGFTVVVPCGPDTVLLVQPGPTLQESMGVVYQTYKPISYFLDRWPQMRDVIERQAMKQAYGAGGAYREQRPDRISEYTWSALTPAFKSVLGTRKMVAHTQVQPPQAFPVAYLQEFWVDDHNVNESGRDVVVKDPYLTTDEHNWWYIVPPGGRLYPRKRLIIFCGDEPVYDGPSPFWHGLFPFTQLSLNPTVWSPFGLSKYRDLLPISKAINEIIAGILDMVNRAVNPQLVARESAVAPAVWKSFLPDQPGGKLRVSAVTDPLRDIRYVEPPPLPAYVVQLLLNYLIPTFDRMSGAIDVSMLGRKRQVPGGETIEQMRDLMQARYRIETRRVEAFLRESGIQMVSNVFQFYTRRQRMRMLGFDGVTLQDFDYDPETMVPATVPKEDHWRMFAVDVAQGSAHGASKDRAKQIFMLLFRLGAISRRHLLRVFEMTDSEIDRIESEIIRERLMGLPVPTIGRVPRTQRAQRTGKT